MGGILDHSFMEMERKKFEAAVKATGRHLSLQRFGPGDEYPGDYKDYSIQCAWEVLLKRLEDPGDHVAYWDGERRSTCDLLEPARVGWRQRIPLYAGNPAYGIPRAPFTTSQLEELAAFLRQPEIRGRDTDCQHTGRLIDKLSSYLVRSAIGIDCREPVCKNTPKSNPAGKGGWTWIKDPNALPPPGEYLGKLRWGASGRIIHQVINCVDADDHSWEMDGSELRLEIDVIAYRDIPGVSD